MGDYADDLRDNDIDDWIDSVSSNKDTTQEDLDILDNND